MKRTKKAIAQDKSIKAKKTGKRISASGNVYHENRENRSDKDLRKRFSDGGSIDSPRIYVADIAAYNEGKLIGEWIDISDYSSGSDVMVAITDLMKKWSKEQGVEREEYAIHDYENFPKSMYSEGMGEDSFDEVIEFYQTVKDSGIPQDVIEKWVDYTGNEPTHITDAYFGSFDKEEDFAYDLVDQLGGVEGVSNPEYYLYVSETDRRVVAGDEESRVREDLESEGELSEEEIEERSQEVYDEWYEGLDDPYYFLVEEQGLYDGKSILDASFVQFDYEKFADELGINDYLYLRGKDHNVYVFSRNYEHGGEITKYKNGGEVKSKIHSEIETLEKALKSPATPEFAKPKLQARLDYLKEKAGDEPKKKELPKTKSLVKTDKPKKKSGKERPKKEDKPEPKSEPKKPAKKVKRTKPKVEKKEAPKAKKKVSRVKPKKKAEPKKAVRKVSRIKPKKAKETIGKARTIRKVKHLNEKGNTKKSVDKKITALHPGKRKSKFGTTYYEYRANRADLNRRKKLEKGGEI